MLISTLKNKKIKLYGSFTATSRYFGVDIGAIQGYAKTFNDIEHLRARIRLVGKRTLFWFWKHDDTHWRF